MQRCAIAFWMLCALTYESLALNVEYLNAKQTVEKAIEISAPVQREKLLHANSLLTLSVLKKHYLPRLKATASGGFENFLGSLDPELYSVNPTSPYSYLAGISLESTLFDGGYAYQASHQQILNSEFQSLNIKAQKNQVAYDTLKFFYDLEAAVLEKKLFQEKKKALSLQFQKVENEYHHGTAIKSDYLRLKIDHETTIISLSDLEYRIQELKKKLIYQIFSDPKPTSEVEFLVEDPIEHFSDMIPNQERKEKSLIEQLTLAQQKIFESEIYNSKRILYPDVRLTTKIAYQIQNTMFGNDGFSFLREPWLGSVTLTINHTLFDWGIRSANLRIAQNTLLTQTVALAAQQQDQAFKKIICREQIKNALENLSLLKELVILEEENRALLEKQLRNGRIKYMDYIIGLKSLFDTKSTFYTHYTKARTAWVEYHYNEGTLYEVF